MIKFWPRELSKYDLMVIKSSPIVHILRNIKNTDQLQTMLKDNCPVVEMEAGPGIETAIKKLTKVPGLLFIKTSHAMYRPFLMETAARLNCPVVVLDQKIKKYNSQTLFERSRKDNRLYVTVIR